MKINYIIEDFSIFGGIERIVSQKASILASEYGHEVTIISVYKDNRPVRYNLDNKVNVIYLNVPMARKNKNPLIRTAYRIATLAKAAKELNKNIKKTSPDIIFFTTTLGALLLPFCSTKAKKIYESHLARNFTPYHKLFFLMEHKADMVVCLTKGDANNYDKVRNVTVIPNFIENNWQAVHDYSAKKAIAIGRLEYQKGFDILIDCWKNVAAKHPDWHLDIWGEGSLRNKLQNQINSLGIKDKITLCGTCNNMSEKYAEYSVHLMTSRYEGQGIVLMEAQAAGLPSVVFDYQYGAREIIKDGITGFVIEQGCANLFTTVVERVLSDVSLRTRQGYNARQNAKAFYTENIMDKWQKLIIDIIDNRK